MQKFTEVISPTTCLCWSLSLRESSLDFEDSCGGGAESAVVASCTFGDDNISRNSRRNAPKNGTTGHSAIANALLKARSYSADNSAADKKSRTGSVSFSVIDNQNGLSLFDLNFREIQIVNTRGKFVFLIIYPSCTYNINITLLLNDNDVFTA